MACSQCHDRFGLCIILEIFDSQASPLSRRPGIAAPPVIWVAFLLTGRTDTPGFATDSRAKSGCRHELGGLLVGRGLVTLDDIDVALERQRAEGGRLGDNLIALGLLTAEQLLSVIHSTPPIPTTISETGIPQRSLLNLLLKFMHLEACETAPELAGRMKLPHRVIQQLMDDAIQQRLLQALGSVRGGIAASIRYALSDQGRVAAKDALEQNLYLGPAPVCLSAYQEQIQRQSISNEMLDADTFARVSGGSSSRSITFASSSRRSMPGAPCCCSDRRVTARPHSPPASRRFSKTWSMSPTLYEVAGRSQVFDAGLHKPLVSEADAATLVGKGGLQRERFDEQWLLADARWQSPAAS